MVIAIDIDGTICEECKTFDRFLAKPIEKAKFVVNKLYEEGNTILLFTARSWSEYRITKEWLKIHEFNYHELIMGKPFYNVFIDDRAMLPCWDKIAEKYLDIRK